MGHRNQQYSICPDSIVVKYDDTKKDKDVVRLSQKNISSNKNDWKLCYWTGLFIWIALRGEEQFKDNKKLWSSKNMNKGVASSNYMEQLVSLL